MAERRIEEETRLRHEKALQEQREKRRLECVENPLAMKVNELIRVNQTTDCLRVPGGWIYRKYHIESGYDWDDIHWSERVFDSETFVPESAMMPNGTKTKVFDVT